MGGVEWWMRDAEGRAGAAYMVIGGAGSWVENQSWLRVFRQVAGTPKSNCPQLATRAATNPTGQRACAIGSLAARPDWEGARSLIWKARPCVAVIWRGKSVIRRATCTRPAAS